MAVWTVRLEEGCYIIFIKKGIYPSAISTQRCLKDTSIWILVKFNNNRRFSSGNIHTPFLRTRQPD